MKKFYDYMLNEEVTIKTEEINRKDCTYITPYKPYVGRVVKTRYPDCILVDIKNDTGISSIVLVGEGEEFQCAHTLSNWRIVE